MAAQLIGVGTGLATAFSFDERFSSLGATIEQPEATAECLLAELRKGSIPIVPVFCGPRHRCPTVNIFRI